MPNTALQIFNDSWFPLFSTQEELDANESRSNKEIRHAINMEINGLIDLVALLRMMKEKAALASTVDLSPLTRFSFELPFQISRYFRGETITPLEFEAQLKTFYTAMNQRLRTLYKQEIGTSDFGLNGFIDDHKLLMGETENWVEDFPKRLSRLQQKGFYYGQNAVEAETLLYGTYVLTIAAIVPLLLVTALSLTIAPVSAGAFMGLGLWTGVILLATAIPMTSIARCKNECDERHAKTHLTMRSSLGLPPPPALEVEESRSYCGMFKSYWSLREPAAMNQESSINSTELPKLGVK